jgi:hypothetical protein
MYEKDGEKYFIVDAHSHFWDASRENWKPGREQYAKGWIDCFYGYHQLAPPETHWDYEHYLKVSADDLEQDVFVDGYVDRMILQSTYLKDWYTEGFNTVDKNGSLIERLGDKIIVNGRFDPREGDAGIKQLEEDAKKWNLKGVKVYTAEWHEGSRGWRLDSLARRANPSPPAEIRCLAGRKGCFWLCGASRRARLAWRRSPHG